MTKYDKSENRVDVGSHVQKSNNRRVKKAWRDSETDQSLRTWARTNALGKEWLLRKGILV